MRTTMSSVPARAKGLCLGACGLVSEFRFSSGNLSGAHRNSGHVPFHGTVARGVVQKAFQRETEDGPPAVVCCSP